MARLQLKSYLLDYVCVASDLFTATICLLPNESMVHEVAHMTTINLQHASTPSGVERLLN